ncbi:hypothetical protein D9611_006803 [Ephemerocybe angulata]|uniref:Uncharacterized protein n=1 Tax=Ephemerocybe angulata TaxID=980116 RepID=A0A8H5B165_9AGAR|nr:hypothetical protein D9611_006803 [Tulosesus angulatus]
MLGRRVLYQITRSTRAATRSASSSAQKAAAPTSVATGQAESTPTTWQAPNFPRTWSTNQAPRPLPGSNPRFEQTIMELQPAPLSAMEMIANEPIRVVQGRKAVCDGGTVNWVLRQRPLAL